VTRPRQLSSCSKTTTDCNRGIIRKRARRKEEGKSKGRQPNAGEGKESTERKGGGSLQPHGPMFGVFYEGGGSTRVQIVKENWVKSETRKRRISNRGRNLTLTTISLFFEMYEGLHNWSREETWRSGDREPASPTRKQKKKRVARKTSR